MKLNERIIKWLRIDERIAEDIEDYRDDLAELIYQLEYPGDVPLKIWAAVRENRGAIDENRERIQVLEAPATEPASGELFDPKSQPYPTHWNGLRVGYVTVKEDVALWYADKDRVLMPYENAAWASNTLGKRITVKASRPATMVYALGGDKHYDLPWPTEFDGGTRAYLVMNEQLIDGHDLTDFEHPKLYIKAADVLKSWVVEVVG